VSGAIGAQGGVNIPRLFDVIQEDFLRFCIDNNGAFKPGALVADIRKNVDAVVRARLDQVSDAELEVACRLVMSSIGLVTVMMTLRTAQQRRRAMH
jgi:hypothetical protein